MEPTPVEPTPVEPTPVEPTPVEPTPVEPTPVEPTPVEPTPVEPTPVDPDPETITVTFQLHTDTDAWILPTVVRDLPEGTTAFEVFKQVLAANGYTYDAKGSYVRAVIAPDGTKVAELSKGQYSGWMYRVNGEFPDTYMGAYELEDGDVIEVFFTADYTKEPGAFLPFVDVTNHWAYTDIKRVYNRGWMVGESATIFAPDQDLTRAMLAVILYAMAGEPEVTAANPFSDVPAGEWYTDAVIWAAANGIVVGCGDGTFRPGRRPRCSGPTRRSSSSAATASSSRRTPRRPAPRWPPSSAATRLHKRKPERQENTIIIRNAPGRLSGGIFARKSVAAGQCGRAAGELEGAKCPPRMECASKA